MTKEELEKEADKWLVDNLHSTEEDYKRAYLAGAEPRERLIVELKGLVNQYKSSKCSGISMVNRNMIMSDQLAKAKDILRRLMENQPTPSSMYEEIDLVGWREVNKEAKQFLKEVK